MLGHLFSPIRIGPLEIRNRLVVPAMVMNYCHADGNASERYTAYHEAKARGGWGMIITENYAVAPEGKGFLNIPGLWDDSQIDSHKAFAARIHHHGSRLFAQIYHAGRQTSRRVIGGRPVAPSPIPCPVMQEVPRELTGEEIHTLIGKFGDCAKRARKAGFDGLEIHGAHGYLIAQFMSPYANKRLDAYGGDLTNRMRFPMEIIADIQGKVGRDFPLIFRISGDELVPGGRTMEETKAIALILEKAGVHALHISAGVYESAYGIVPPAAIAHGWITGFAEEVKKIVSIPVMTVGRITDPILAESIIAEGKADLVAMGRASLADPDLPVKAAAGKFADINHCIGCMQGCNGRITLNQPATCLVNPTLGKEASFRIIPAERKRRVFVAGAGPAGMEAAMVAAKRGHEVQLFEKTGRVGGQFHTASIPPDKGELAGFIAWQKKQLDDLGVSIHLHRGLSEEIVHRERPDVVVIATGSRPLPPDLVGIKNTHVVTAHDLLEEKAHAGQRVVIIGGGMVGSETASHLAGQGRSVTIVEMLSRIAADEAPAARHFLMKDLKGKKVTILVNATVKEILSREMIIVRDGREERIGPFDTVVLAVGVTPCNTLRSSLDGKVETLMAIGDAVGPRNALDATAEGYTAGLSL